MKPYHLKRIAALALATLLGGSAVQAIKITVPKQYEEQVEAMKQAERAEVESQIGSVESGESTTPAQGDGGMQFGAGDNREGGATTPDAAATRSGPSDPLAQSLAEATKTAEDFELEAPEGQGFVSGQIVDKDSGQPLPGVAILIESTEVATITDAEGRYTLGPAPAGDYTVNFFKSGYIEANVTDFTVAADEVSVFPFALPPRPTEMSDEVYVLQDFSVTASEANQMMMNLDIRMDADSIMDVLGAEDLSRFADSDVASAVKRVAGVSVQDGKFAVIRGLDERYSSSLLNNVPVPSPDPERQSVPLDLFPSEVVQNLTVSKTFSPSDPSNSAGGSINIVTSVFPDEFTVKSSFGFGINENAQKRFLEPSQSRLGIDFDNVLNLSANDLQGFGGVPQERDSEDVIDHSFDVRVGDTTELFGKTFKYLSSVAYDKSYDTKFGTEQRRKARQQDVIDGEVQDMTFTDAQFDVTESESTEQITFLLATELFLDEDEKHSIGYTLFHTQTEQEFAALRENGTFPDLVPAAGTFDPDNPLADDFFRRTEAEARLQQTTLQEAFAPAVRAVVLNIAGAASNSNLLTFYDQLSLIDLLVLQQERQLTVHQLSGNHEFLDGSDDELHVSWAGSYSEATQEDIDAFRVGAFDLPEAFGGGFITGAVGGGFDGFDPDRSWRRIEEEQKFFRTDGRYLKRVGDWLQVEPSLGLFVEETERNSEQFFTGVGLFNLNGSGTQPFPDLESGIEENIDSTPPTQFQPAAVAVSTRESDGFYFRSKATFREKWEFIFGARVEQLQMFTQTETGSAGNTFFNSDILMDNDDDPTNSGTPSAALRNAQILGINNGLPLPPGFQGEIEEDLFLPSLSLTYRPTDSTRLTLAYSQTNVRPSFKEFTFLTVRNPTSLDLESGNPTLTTSDVESFDFRLDHTFNDRGDRGSIALFHKKVSDPIEKTNLSNTDIFFNNPNEATIQGVELEFRKFLGGFGPEWLEYFSVGGNVAFIDAVVGVPKTFRERLQGNRFGVEDPDKERRLFQQPEWLVNADLRFEQPDWGTQATLSLFAQSEVLDTAGGFDGRNATIDTYQSSFEELNFTLSQRINEHFSIKFTAKNITDSERGLEYDDPGGAPERTFRLGREFSVSVSGTF